jgi:3-dehydrosphinganine reductase
MNKYKLALITGGSSGIGLAVAKALAQEGVHLCLLARDLDKLQAAQEEVRAYALSENQRVETISCDITQYDALCQALHEWTATAGIPDLVVNSAGVTYPGYFQELDVDIFHWLMDINYFGTLHVIKCLIHQMLERGSGTIVNICSQASFAGVFGYSGYGASKYAVRGLSDVLRSEMKPYGIHVAIVFPPDTQTPQLEFEEPLKPVETRALASVSKATEPELVAKEILKDIKKGKYVIIPGFEGKVVLRVINLLGNLIYPIIDWLVGKAQKKK